MMLNTNNLRIFVVLFISGCATVFAQQVQLNGKVLEINSGRSPIANVNVKSDNGANTVQSDSNGEYTLTFQDQGYGALVFVDAQKSGYELVNEKAMQLFLPDSSQYQKMNLEVILCKEGYLDQARIKYYEITDKHIKEEFEKRYDRIITEKKEGWQKERVQLLEDMETLRKRLENQAEDYIRTNRDDLSEKELEARRLFEAGKLDESLTVRASMNSEEELEKELENNKRAKENKVKAEKEIIASEKGIETHRRNLKEEAVGFILKFQFNKAEQKLRTLATIDSTNFNSVFGFAYFLTYQNQTQEAIISHQKALKLAKYQSDVALTQNLLGILYMDLNNYDAALKSYTEALEIRKRLAKDNPKKYEPYVAGTQNNLGAFYVDLNNYDAALKSYTEALEIKKRFAKDNPKKYEPDVALTQSNLGILYYNLNDYDAALKSYTEALEIKKRFAKDNPKKYEPDVALTQINLGSLYYNLNNYDAALKSYTEALEIKKRFAKDNPKKYEPAVALIQISLGALYHNLNNYDAALKSYTEALEIYKRFVEDNPKKYEPYVAVTQFNLGAFYVDLNNYDAALKSYTEALEIRKRFAKDNPKKYEPDVANTQNNLGAFYVDLNNYDAALKSYTEALEIRKRFAKDNPKKYEPYVAETQFNLGAFYVDLNNYDAALKSYTEALEIRKRFAKDNPKKYEPYVADTQNNLGNLYKNLKNYDAALKNFTKALEIRKRLAEEKPKKYEIEVATTIINIGFLQKQFSKGEIINGHLLELELTTKIVTKYADLALAKKLINDIRNLQTYFTAYELFEEGKSLSASLNALNNNQQKVPFQKKIISKYQAIYNLGFDYRFSIGKAQGSLAFYQLFAKDFTGAEQTAREALNPTKFEKPNNYDTEIEWVNTNLALALLYQGKYEQAKVIYINYKDKPYNDKTYKKVFLEDLKDLEDEGITHPDVEKIRNLLQNE